MPGRKGRPPVGRPTTTSRSICAICSVSVLLVPTGLPWRCAKRFHEIQFHSEKLQIFEKVYFVRETSSLLQTDVTPRLRLESFQLRAMILPCHFEI